MGLDMRALYYIALSALSLSQDETNLESTRAIEHCLNQNFAIIAAKIAELDARVPHA